MKLRFSISYVLRRYARQADNCQLQMDSLWRLGDWDALKRHVLPRAQVSPLIQQRTCNCSHTAHAKRTSIHSVGACPFACQGWPEHPQHCAGYCPNLWCNRCANMRLQVDDGSWAHMVHAYVHLQEGNIVEGEQNITNAMKAALIRHATIRTILA